MKTDRDGFIDPARVTAVGPDNVTGVDRDPKPQPTKSGWCGCPDEDDSPIYYDFTDDDGRRYHGWDCSRCGGLVQTG